MKKLISVLIAITMISNLFAIMPFSVNASERNVVATGDTSGTTGSCKWTLNGTVLTISGCGAMGNYCGYEEPFFLQNRPWGKYITKAIIEDGVTNIGGYAFGNCAYLEKVVIANSVTEIEPNAFENCKGLISINIPNSVKSIGIASFERCENLTNISIPNSVTSIGKGAFVMCNSLTSITVPESVTSIGDWAFDECDNLASITLPGSVTSIGDYTFNRCKSLTSITIPDSITELGKCSFSECDKLESVVLGKSVCRIGYSAFERCKNLTSITLPESVTSIGDWAFSMCNSLTSITIPESVTSIGKWAFYKCSLTSITIPKSVTSIGNSTFRDCTSLTYVSIPKAVTSIETNAFSGCSSLTDVYYSGCEDDWKKISIGESNEYLTGATFHFNSIESNTSIEASDPGENNDFLYYPNVNGTCSVYDYVGESKDVVIPETIDGLTVTKLDGTFSFLDLAENGISNSQIQSISIPRTVTEINEFTFNGCSSLKEIKVDSQNTNYKTSDGVLYTFDSTKLICYPAQKADTHFTIPNNVSYVYNYAFYHCSNLTELNATHTMEYQGQEIIDYVNKDLLINLMAGSELHVNAINKKINYKIADIYNYANDINGFDLKTDGYSFINSAQSFYYSNEYKIPLSVYQSVFGDSYTQQQYESEGKWGGNCFGMSITAALFDKGYLNASSYGSKTVNNLYDSFTWLDGYARLKSDSDLKNLIECYQIWQGSEESDSMELSLVNTIKTYEGMFLKVIDILQQTKEPLLVCVSWDSGAHALVVDSSRKPENLYGDLWRIYLYDPNNPYSSKDFVVSSYSYSETRYIDVNVKTGEWYIDVALNSDSGSKRVGYDNNGKCIEGSNVYFFSSETATKNVFSHSATLTPSDDSNKTAININDKNIIVLDNNNNTVFKANKGKIVYIDDNCSFNRNISNMDGEESALSGKLILPKGTYSLSLSDKGCVQILNASCFVGITSSGNTSVKVAEDGIVYCNGDEGTSNSVVIEKTNGDSYTSVKTVNEYSNGKDNTRIQLDDNNIYTNSASNATVEVISDKTEDKEYRIESFNNDNSTSIADLALEEGYIIETDSITDTPTEAPTESTTKATDAPVTDPTEPVTTAPTEPLAENPTEATEPVAKATETPTTNPTDAPVTDPTETVTDKPTEPVVAQPTTEATTQSATEAPKTTVKKPNSIKVSVKKKTVALKKLKKKAQTVKAIIVKKNKGKVTYKLVKKGITKKIRKIVKISSKGVITIKRWKKAKKGNYKIKVKITARGNKGFNEKTITKTVKIRIK